MPLHCPVKPERLRKTFQVWGQYLFDKNPLYIGFSRAKPEHEALTITFSEAIAELKKTGRYQRMLEKYHLKGSGEDLPK